MSEATGLRKRVAELEAHLRSMPSQLMAYKADVKALQTENAALAERLKASEAEKADMVLRNKLLRDRPDLPIERLDAYDQLVKQYQVLVQFYDTHVGTPCEQIRHQQEVEDLKARLKACEVARDAYQRLEATHRATCHELIADLAAAPRAEVAELTTEVEWYGTLVRRASIGTGKTPSLRAYIEQLEAKNVRLTTALESIAANTCCGSCQEAKLVAQAALTEPPEE